MSDPIKKTPPEKTVETELDTTAEAAVEAAAPDGFGWGIRNSAWHVQEVLIWRGGDLLRHLGDAAKWPFEKAVWAFQRKLSWPVREWLAARNLPSRSAVASSFAVVLGAAAVTGGVVAAGSGTDAPVVQTVTVAQSSTPNVAPVADLPATSALPVETLKGVPPIFKSTSSKLGKAETDPAKTSKTSSSSSERLTKADAKKVAKPLNVARRFADAFVSYEVGKDTQKAQAVFAQTARKPLAKSLADRPPRLPSNGRVPKAKVLNVVPGPQDNKQLAVSVAMLRLGVTSELRLQMEQTRLGWFVSEVKG